jgi:hypothetical protein
VEKLKMATLIQLNNKSFAYNETNKNQLHRAALKALRKIAAGMGLQDGEFDIRSNKAGIAVSGEITLHTDKVYVQVSESSHSNGITVLFRTCNGRKDYCGGQNNFASVEKLESPAFLEQLKKMSL